MQLLKHLLGDLRTLARQLELAKIVVGLSHSHAGDGGQVSTLDKDIASIALEACASAVGARLRA